jgi:thiol-disulfide isomerase/thioredoxin
MKQLAILTLLLINSVLTFSQEDVKKFPDAVKENIKKYNAVSNKAYEVGDLEKGQFFFDTLVSNHLVGTKFEDYTFKRVFGGKLKLSSIKKPILIQTYSSWCVMNKGEVQALNKLSKKYNKNLQIVVLFWDRKRDAKEVSNQFSGNIEVCYASEHYNKDGEAVATLKYAIGFLSSYYLDSDLKVVAIKKGTSSQLPQKTPMKDCIQFNFDIYNESLSNLILKSGITKGELVRK